MKIVNIKGSILFLRINTDNDTVKCFFIFFISWNCFKINTHVFQLSELPMSGIKEFYKQLADDWNRKYRI